MSRPRYCDSPHSVSWGWGWRWLPSVAIAMVCLASFIVLLAPTPVGQRAANTWRFLFGWQYIAQHQQQLNQTVAHLLQKTGLPATVYRLESTIPQRRGQEYWQRQNHVVRIPPERSLETFEALFRETLSRAPFIILDRRIRQASSYTTVKLTLGMAGVPTDVFVLTQAVATVIPSIQVSNAPILSPLGQSFPLHQSLLPQVAIVIDDLGWDLGAAQVLLAMDIPLGFAILPNTPFKDFIAQEAQRRGKDILLHLPMEPYSYPQIDPGWPVLLSTMNTSELAIQIESALAAVPAAVGVNNHMGSRLTEDRHAMHVVMQLMKHRNLFFLDSRTSQKSLAYQIAREVGVRTAQRHVFLDNEADARKISQQLHRLAALAREHGKAIGIGHPYPETVQSLRYTLPEIRQTGVEIVSISRLVQ